MRQVDYFNSMFLSKKFITFQPLNLFIYSSIFVQDPAPAHILNIIRCNPSMNTKNPCRKQCQCRRHGIKCMTACRLCQGSECTNAMENYDTNSSEDDYESSEYFDGNIFEKLLDLQLFKFCINSL